jgi:hypothetical protein
MSTGKPWRRCPITGRSLSTRPTWLLASDRGVYSEETEAKLVDVGVKRVAIPAIGKVSEERRAVEHTRTWKGGGSLARRYRGEDCQSAPRIQLAQMPLY